MPFKDDDDSSQESFHIQETDQVLKATERIKRILDAKCEAANLEEICRGQEELNEGEQQQLLALLRKHEPLFDGQLGKWKGSTAELELIEGATPYHARVFPLPFVYHETLKTEVK